MPSASINFVTAHDGFTLADLTSYDEKHNEANGEDNKDGESHNRSWNCGVEGPTDDPEIQELRARQRRNLLVTLMLSQGVPMIAHGDELGRTQQGNNNAYCQDNELSWMDWELEDENAALLEFARKAVRLRRDHPILHRRRFFDGSGATEALGDIEWLDLTGARMDDTDWHQSYARTVAVFLNGDAISETGGRGERVVDDSFLLLLNAHSGALDFTLPPGAYGKAWTVVLDTDGSAEPGTVLDAGTGLTVTGRSVVVLTRPSGTPG
jgi:isoamylase